MAQDHTDWRLLLRQAFGLSFWVFVILAIASAAICYSVLGKEAFTSAATRDGELLAALLPRVLAAQVVAGFVWVLVPRERLRAMLSRQSGGDLILASVGGIITPGGPASAFPFLAIMAGVGADRGVLVAYITSWALLGIQRIIVWDIPFMGIEFSLLRFVVSLPLPIIAGIIARRMWVDGASGKRPTEGDG